jgi:hypothetical protein
MTREPVRIAIDGGTTRVRWILAGLALAAAVVLVVRLGYRERHWDTYRRQVVVRLAWGSGPDQVGRSLSLSGTGDYGPLAFTVGHGRLVIADTYNDRVLIRGLDGGPWTTIPAPRSELTAACYLPGSLGLFMADDRRLTVWRVAGTRLEPWVSLPAGERHTTSTLWRVDCGGDGRLYVEDVAVGRGRFHLGLLASDGRELKPIAQINGEPAVPEPLGPPLESFDVGPGGVWYLSQASPATHAVRIAVEKPLGTKTATWTIQIRDAVHTVQLLGLAAGRLFVGVNLGRRGMSGTVVVLN